MESLPLVLSDPNMLAEFVRQSQLKTFFEKRFAAPEDIGAVLFRDGAVIDGYAGTQFSIGGLWENLKGVLGGSHHYEIMLATLKPFQAVIPVRGVSKDQIELVGEATFELQLNPEKITSILGLMHGVGRNERDPDSKEPASATRKALLVADLVARLEPHFRERVFGADLARHNADEIRGNAGMQDQLQADAMQEAERLFGDLGVLVRGVTVNFAMNEAERQAFERARIERDEKMKDFQLGLIKQQVAREADATSFKLGTNLDLAKLQSSTDDELRHLLLETEAGFVDAREAIKRRQEFAALDHEARLLLTENKAKAEIALTQIGDATAQSRARLGLVKADGEITAYQRDFDRQQKLLEAELGLDVIKIDVEGQGIKFDQSHAEMLANQKAALDQLERINQIEVGKAAGLADVEIKVADAKARGELDKMVAAGSLTAEQLAQVMPALSESAANVAIARAQSEGMNAEQMVQLARDMTAESRAHEHQMFETGMKGGTGMAAGLGGSGSVPASMGGAAGETVECPHCKTVNAAKAKYCKTCGTQLRN